MAKKKTPGDRKASKVFSEFKAGTLNSGSKTGPIVKNRKQAIAIALSERDRANAKGKGRKKRKR